MTRSSEDTDKRRALCRVISVGACGLLLSCDHSLTRGVHDSKSLTQRVRAEVPVGSDTSLARRQMERNGFSCAFRLGSDVDSLERDSVAPPPPRLTCIKDVAAQPETADGFHRYLVDFFVGGMHTDSVEARVWMERRD
jgi:hypothetical protein